jgi:hypothetical protein
VFSVNEFEEYLDFIGGMKQLNYLKQVEEYRAPLKAPWIK